MSEGIGDHPRRKSHRLWEEIWNFGPVIAITFAVVVGVAAGIIGYRRLDASQA